MVYHTVTISDTDSGYVVVAISNDGGMFEIVDSIAIGGEYAGIMVEGWTKLEAAEKAFDVQIVDFEEEYGYTEAQITFVDQ